MLRRSAHLALVALAVWAPSAEAVCDAHIASQCFTAWQTNGALSDNATVKCAALTTYKACVETWAQAPGCVALPLGVASITAMKNNVVAIACANICAGTSTVCGATGTTTVTPWDSSGSSYSGFSGSSGSSDSSGSMKSGPISGSMNSGSLHDGSSGSNPSNSAGENSSGSLQIGSWGYYLEIWQWVLLTCCCLGLCGGGGAGAMMMSKKKKPKGGKKSVPQDYPEPALLEQAPVAEMPLLEEPAPALVPVATTSTMLPQYSAQQPTYTYAQPQYSQYTTSYAAPMTQYAQPMTTSYAAQQPMTTSYAAPVSYATPGTTSYVVQGGYEGYTGPGAVV